MRAPSSPSPVRTSGALGAGVSLKPEHFDEADAAREAGLWFEVHPENYMVDGGPRLAWLARIRESHPVALHGVGLSLAGVAPPDSQHLQRLAALARRIEPALVSEHLAWCRQDNTYVPDLLPFVRSNEALTRMAAHVDRVQCALGRRIAVENPSHYLPLAGHDWDEPAFLAELCRRSGCGLLLDLNNVYVSAHNLGYDALEYLERLPLAQVMEVHLAGHGRDPLLGDALLIDSHDAPVAEPVWALHEALVARTGPLPTLIERDAALPSFAELLRERARAQRLASHAEAAS